MVETTTRAPTQNGTPPAAAAGTPTSRKKSKAIPAPALTLEGEGFLRPDEIAQILNLSRSKAYELADQLEHVELGRVTRVAKCVLREFIARSTRPARAG